MPSEAPHHSNRTTLTALWATLVAESLYVVYTRFELHTTWGRVASPLVYIAVLGALAASRGRVRWIAALVRIAIGSGFIVSVSDRFGLLGPRGGAISWGDFAHFVAYTHQVNAFLPMSLAPFLAVLATICETTCGITLILGVGIPLAARAAAILLLLFGSAMVASGLIASQFDYAVFALAAGALTLASVDASLLSVDALRSRIASRIR